MVRPVVVWGDFQNVITPEVLAPDAPQQIINQDYERVREPVRKSGATASRADCDGALKSRSRH